jgi:hypothetical protein
MINRVLFGIIVSVLVGATSVHAEEMSWKLGESKISGGGGWPNSSYFSLVYLACKTDDNNKPFYMLLFDTTGDSLTLELYPAEQIAVDDHAYILKSLENCIAQFEKVKN